MLYLDSEINFLRNFANHSISPYHSRLISSHSHQFIVSVTNVKSVIPYVSLPLHAQTDLFPRCMECQRGLAMRKVFARLSACQTREL